MTYFVGLIFAATFSGFYAHPSPEAFGVFAFASLALIATQLIQAKYQKDPFPIDDAVMQAKHEIKELRENEVALKLRFEELSNKLESIKAALQIRTLGH